MIDIDKSKMKDEKGRYIVQGLFLEDRYNYDMALFTFAEEDKKAHGKTFYSLKRLYLEMADPVEYTFAKEYLCDWPHWQRLCKNAIIGRHVEQWREELKLKLASEGVLKMFDLATEKDSYQAAKYLADGGWIKNERGRPSKEQVESELKKRADEASEWDEDNSRVLDFMKGKK